MKLYLYITNPEGYINGDVCFHAMTREMEIDVWILAGSIDFDEVGIAFPLVNDKEIRKIALASIEKQVQNIRAEFEVDLGSLEERKQKLLSITHQPLSEPELSIAIDK